jgi:hypothetical protein
MIWSTLKTKLDKQISHAKGHVYSFMERITLVNQVFMASDWYILALWVGYDSQLKELEKKICTFLWEGCKAAAYPRISYAQLTCPIAEGGVDLISKNAQVSSMVSKQLFWAVSIGTQPLQIILRGRIAWLSWTKWGNSDYSWLTTPCQLSRSQESEVWTNITKAWTKAKRVLIMRPPRSLEEVNCCSVWVPEVIHKDPKEAGCSSSAQKMLRQGGLERYSDNLDTDGNFVPWE